MFYRNRLHGSVNLSRADTISASDSTNTTAASTVSTQVPQMSTDTTDNTSDSERKEQWETATEDVRERFDAEDVTEEDIKTAIEWVRSE